MATKPASVRLTSGYWASLSDAELLRARFTTDDPEAVEGLVLDVPEDAAEDPIIEQWYDFRGSKRQMVRCAHCRYPNHLAGYVIRVGDSRFLCGHDCGARIYGVGFEAFSSDFRQARDRAVSLKRIEQLKLKLPDLNAFLFDVRTSAIVSAFKDFKAQFRSAMPRLHGALEVASLRNECRLYLPKVVRDYEAENKADDRYDNDIARYEQASPEDRVKLGIKYPQRPKKPVTKVDQQLVGSFPSPTLFTSSCFKKAHFDSLASQFAALGSHENLREEGAQQAFAYRGRGDRNVTLRAIRTEVTTVSFERILRDANTLLDKLDAALDQIAELPAFFGRHSLATVAHWATEREDLSGAYTAVGERLTCETADGVATIALPKDFKIPDRKALRTFRDAINLV